MLILEDVKHHLQAKVREIHSRIGSEITHYAANIFANFKTRFIYDTKSLHFFNTMGDVFDAQYKKTVIALEEGAKHRVGK